MLQNGCSTLCEYLTSSYTLINCDKTLGDSNGMFYFVREVKRGEEKIGQREEIGAKLADYRNHAPGDSIPPA